MTKIGYVGLGNMGGPLAARLQLAHPLLVFDQLDTARDKLIGLGARGATHISQLAECDVIFVCLPTSEHVRDFIFDDGGLLDHLRPGTLLVDQTTGDPNETRCMHDDLARRGIELIDAPVSGGRAAAEAGTIAIMVGASEAQFGRVLPVLEAISDKVFYAGPVGSGHAIKLVNNLMSTVQRLLTFEGVALAAKCGIDPRVATAILLKGGARNAYLEQMMQTRILQGKLNAGFTLALAHKDLRLACQLGDEVGVPMQLGHVARGIYQACMSEMGDGAQVDTIGLYYDRLAGTSVVPEPVDLH